MKKLLLIDDDEITLLTTGKYLSKSGYEILSAKDGKSAVKLLEENGDIDLVIIDVVMPGMDGIEVCRFIRNDAYPKRLRTIPILMLTAMSDITDKYMGFDAGADDYLTKPFEPLELLMRVKALIKRQINTDNEVQEVEDDSNTKLRINKDNYSVFIGEDKVYLTSVEFDIFYYLYSNSGRAVSAEELLEKVMNYPAKTGNAQIIRTHIKNLRAKIEKDSENPKYITTVTKRGYMFNKE